MSGEHSKECLKQILTERKKAITDKWFTCILDAYPPQTIQFLKSNTNQFANPVGHTYHDNLAEIYDMLVNSDSYTITSSIIQKLDEIIRIRAVQGLTPADALSFIFDLKTIIHDEIVELTNMSEVFDFYKCLDLLALKAFEIYSKCRDTIYEIRVKEFERNHYRLLQMANIICAEQEKNTKQGEVQK